MNKFKVGEKVKVVKTKVEMTRINNYNGILDKGFVGVVSEVCYGSYKLDGDEQGKRGDREFWMREGFLESAEKPEQDLEPSKSGFKVGDRVVMNPLSKYYDTGKDDPGRDTCGVIDTCGSGDFGIFVNWGTGWYNSYSESDLLPAPVEELKQQNGSTQEITYPNPVHPHKDLIIEWAKGADIEQRAHVAGQWHPAIGPTWSAGNTYRVKPIVTKTPLELERESLLEEVAELKEFYTKTMASIEKEIKDVTYKISVEKEL